MPSELETSLEKYAELAVKVWLNVQPGQRLAIHAPIEAASLVRSITKIAYQLGSPLVNVIWEDEQLRLLRFQYAPRDSFAEYPEWLAQASLSLAQRGDAVLALFGEDPDLLKEQEPALIALANETQAKHLKPFSDLVQRDVINWLVLGIPIASWAAAVFPDLAREQQVARLWDTIFRVCRVTTPNPVRAWQIHLDELARRSAYLNQKQYPALQYHAPGTTLTMGLPNHHNWMSGRSISQQGISFVANIPTEEVFTMPHRMRVNGVVTSTKPLSIRGVDIEEFNLTFQEGEVVDVAASNDLPILRDLLKTDAGAAYLGEVALVPNSSPVALSGIQFHNALFDENAASHLALGSAYPFTLQGGNALSKEELATAGANDSLIHVDFMIGSGEMDIDGISTDGVPEPVMRRGEWAFEV